MKGSDIKDIAIGGGIIVAVYLIGKKILETLNIIDTKEEKESSETIEDEYAATLKNQKPTKTKGEWQIIAENIYEAMKYSGTDEQIVFMNVMRVKNNADFALLAITYGKRQLYAFAVPEGGKRNLIQSVNSELSRKYITNINNSYANKNIKYRF